MKYVDPDGRQVAIPSPMGPPIIVPIFPVSNPDNTHDYGIIKKGQKNSVKEKKEESDVSEKLKDSASSPCPDPDPNNNDEDDLTPEDIEEYNQSVKKRYESQLRDLEELTEIPEDKLSKNEISNAIPPNLRGWGKIIYILSKVAELFDNMVD